MSETSSGTFVDRARKAALNRWKLETWTKTLGIQGLAASQQTLQKNQEAMSRATRRQLWGEEENAEGEEMPGHTYLGDVNHPTPVIVTGAQGGNSLGPLLAAALGMLGPAGAVGGYFLNQMMQQQAKAPDPIVQPGANTTVINRENLQMQLLREEDLIPAP